jgi:hypothetical protein
MRRSRMLAMAVLVTAACGKGSSGQGSAADSTASPSLTPGGVSADSVGAVPGMRNDSSLVRPRAGMSAGPVKEPPKATDSIIGYDSAFGPSFTVDSTGRIVPIVKKKP